MTNKKSNKLYRPPSGESQCYSKEIDTKMMEIGPLKFLIHQSKSNELHTLIEEHDNLYEKRPDNSKILIKNKKDEINQKIKEIQKSNYFEKTMGFLFNPLYRLYQNYPWIYQIIFLIILVIAFIAVYCLIEYGTYSLEECLSFLPELIYWIYKSITFCLVIYKANKFRKKTEKSIETLDKLVKRIKKMK